MIHRASPTAAAQTTSGRRDHLIRERFRHVTQRAGLRPAPPGKLFSEGWNRKMKWALDMGLPAAESLTDRSIPTFSRARSRISPGSTLRVETESMTDVGAVAPLLGGQGMRCDPRPAPLVSQRRRLVFVYHDGQSVERLDFAAARRLIDDTAATQFELAPNA